MPVFCSVKLFQLYSELKQLRNPASTNNLPDLLSTGGQRSFIAAATKQNNKEVVNITHGSCLNLAWSAAPFASHSAFSCWQQNVYRLIFGCPCSYQTSRCPDEHREHLQTARTVVGSPLHSWSTNPCQSAPETWCWPVAACTGVQSRVATSERGHSSSPRDLKTTTWRTGMCLYTLILWSTKTEQSTLKQWHS